MKGLGIGACLAEGHLAIFTPRQWVRLYGLHALSVMLSGPHLIDHCLSPFYLHVKLADADPIRRLHLSLA